MDFLDLCDSLDELKSMSGSNAKKEFLSILLKEPVFVRMCQMALDSRLSYNMSKVLSPQVGFFRASGKFTTDTMFEYLERMSSKRGLSNQEKQVFSDMCHNTSQEAVRIANVIISGDLKCGVKEGLINKVVPDTVFVWPYMRCRSWSKKNFSKIDMPAIAEVKANGQHIDLVFDGSSVEFYSREGNKYNFLGVHDEELAKFFRGWGPCVVIGEGLVLNEDGTYMDRSAGNGIISKALSGTITESEAKRVRFRVWEYVDYNEFFKKKGEITYATSLEIIESMCQGFEIIQPIDYIFVNDESEVMAYYEEKQAEGEEGLVVKNMKGKFEHTDSGSKNQVKVKAIEGKEFEMEVRITGISPGKEGTKNEGFIGALFYESACGKLKGKVGGGMCQEFRERMTEEDLIDRIATVRFDEIVQDKRDLSMYSLYAPRLMEVRTDKKQADTLEYAKSLITG